MIPRGLQRFLMLILLALLSACSMPRMIDSDVQSFAGAGLASGGAEFRFDRLPSQQQNTDFQDTLESLAQEALERIGLTRNDTSGRYLAQVSLGVDNIRNPHYRPPRPRLVRGADGRLYEEWPLTPAIEVPWYRHRVHLTLRDSSTSQVDFETTAVFDGPWRDTLNLVPPMLEAALKDYPTPGKRRVVVELPPAGKGER
ncbi:DUF4136 domain-containing protein [Rhodoferax sp.]|uniref:DUF4136 domain-containing protein n=1 Tax=Rhodoferax sp. TaxID=50421 RepID=UPI0025D98AB7|nr:DUF4136 domain-containing protein [Rhodoferax sp.]